MGPSARRASPPSLLPSLLTSLSLAALACVPPLDEPDAGPSYPEEAALIVAAGAPAPDEDDAPAAIVPTLPQGLAEQVTVLDAGVVAMPEGRSPEVLLDVPAGVEGVVLLASAHPGVHVILERTLGPDGDVLIDDRAPDDLDDAEEAIARGFPAQFFSPNRVVPGREVGAFLVPSTPDVPFGPGRYRLRFSTWSVTRANGEVTKVPVARPVHLAALVKHANDDDKAEPGGALRTLDLTLHLTGAGGLTSDNAPDDAHFQAALEVVREALGRIGMRLGRLSYVDVEDAGFRTVVLGEGCEGGDLDELMRLSTQGTDGVHLFVVERFQCLINGGVDVGQGIGGMTAGLPGPPWLRGTPRSGVAVATAPFGDDARRLGVVLAHELGHFLGLYHTKENDLFGGPAIYDPISDTPDDERAEHNLMYFLATDHTELSDGQASVVRASPWGLP